MGIFSSGPSYEDKGGDDQLLTRYNQMRLVASTYGIDEPKPGEMEQPGFFQRTIEFISRPLFAITGVADHMLGTADEGETVQSRVVAEILGQGKKEFFGDVLEQRFPDKDIKLSELIGDTWLTNHWDPGVRGGVGLVLDIFADPLTYVGVGAIGNTAKAISRGGKVALSEIGASALGHTIDRSTGILARKLGRMRYMTEVGERAGGAAGARKAAGESLERQWWEAAEKGGKARQAMFDRIHAEAAERGLLAAREAADNQARHVAFMKMTREHADNVMERVLSGRASVRETKDLLKAAGLNPEAANLADEVAKLIAPNVVSYWLPFKGRVTLFELGKSGKMSRLRHTITDPFTSRFVNLLESHNTTATFLRGIKSAKETVLNNLDKLFNRHVLNARKLGQYVDLVDEYRQGEKLGVRRAQEYLDSVFEGIDDEDFIESAARFLDNPSEDRWTVLLDAAEAAGYSIERATEFVMELRRAYETVGLADTKNGVLQMERFEAYRGRYVPHMIDGWDELTEGQREAVITFFKSKNFNRNPHLRLGDTRFFEHRFYSNYDELEAFLGEFNTKHGTNLSVNFDLYELTLRRVAASIEAGELTKFFNKVKARFARTRGLEELGVLGAVMPDLLKAFDPKKVTGAQAATLNRILARTTSVGDDIGPESFIGITNVEDMVRAGLDEGTARFLKLVQSLAPDSATRVEYVNVLRTTVDEAGQVFQVTGSTVGQLQGDVGHVLIRLFEGADATTVAKEWMRRGWKYLTEEEQGTFQRWFQRNADQLVDPETGKAYTGSADAFAQLGSDFMLGEAVGRFGPGIRRIFEKFRQVLRTVLGRARDVRKLTEGTEIPDLFRKAQVVGPENIQVGALSDASLAARFGIGEQFQRISAGKLKRLLKEFAGQGETFGQQNALPGGGRGPKDLLGPMLKSKVLHYDAENGSYFGNAREIAGWISDTTQSPQYKLLAKGIQRTFERSGIESIPVRVLSLKDPLVNDMGFSAYGMFKMSGREGGRYMSPRIYLAGPNWPVDRLGFDEHTIMHEMVHAATVMKLFNPIEHLHEVKRLRELMDHVRDHFIAVDKKGMTVQEKILAEQLGTWDIQMRLLKDDAEFLAYAMSNARAQEWLKTIPGMGTKTAWQSLVDIIRKVLGIKGVEDTALEEILDVSYRLLFKDFGAKGKTDMLKFEDKLANAITGGNRDLIQLVENHYGDLNRKLKLHIDDVIDIPLDDVPKQGQKLRTIRGTQHKVAMKGGREVIVGSGEKTVKQLPALRAMAANAVAEGIEGRYWYEKSSMYIMRMMGGDTEAADKFAQLIAIYSQSNEVESNFEMAIRAWNQYVQTGKIEVRRGFSATKEFPRGNDEMAEAVMRGDFTLTEKYEKIFPFYSNLRSSFPNATEAQRNAVTIDRWMGRAFGMPDAPSTEQKLFLTREIQRLRHVLEAATGDKWTPAQVQAAIWVQAKAQKYGLDKALVDYADAAKARLAQVSWESAPGDQLALKLPGYAEASVGEKLEFHKALSEIFVNPEGQDLIASRLGLTSPRVFEAPGAWKGEVTPGSQTEVVVGFEKGAPQGRKRLDQASRDLVETYAAILGEVLGQNGVGWHKPYFDPGAAKITQNGLEIGRSITAEESTRIQNALYEAFGWDVFMAGTEDGFRIIRSVPEDEATRRVWEKGNKDFQEKVVKILEAELDGEIPQRTFQADAGLVMRGDDGQGYRQRARAAGRSDVFEELVPELSAAAARVRGVFEDRYGWNYEPVAPAKRTGKQVRIVHVSGEPSITHVDPRYFEGGAERSRILSSRGEVMPGQMLESSWMVNKATEEPLGQARYVFGTSVDEGLMLKVPMEWKNTDRWRPADWYRRGYKGYIAESRYGTEARLLEPAEVLPMGTVDNLKSGRKFNVNYDIELPDAFPEGTPNLDAARSGITRQTTDTAKAAQVSKEEFQRRPAAREVTARTRQQAERQAQFAGDARVRQARALRAEAEALSEDASLQRVRRAEARLKAAGLREGEAQERQLLTERRAQRQRDIAIKKRQKLRVDQLRKLQDLMEEEERAILAQTPEAQMDLFGDLKPSEGMEKVTKNALKALRAKRTRLVKRAKAEISAEAGEVAEAVGRQREYNVQVAQMKYAKGRFSQVKREFEEEVREAHAAAQGPREAAAKLRAQADDLTKGLRRPSLKDVQEEDLRQLRAMPDDVKAAFMHQVLLHVRDLEHLEAVLQKYEGVWHEINPGAVRKARETVKDRWLEAGVSPYAAAGGRRLQEWREVEIGLGENKMTVQLPEGIAEDLRNWESKYLETEEIKGALRIFDWLTNTFKVSVTVPFPAFHFRNAYGNVFQTALDITIQALNPKRHAEAVAVMLGGTKWGKQLGIPEFTMVDRLGNRYTSAQIRSLAEAYDIKVDFADLAEIVAGRKDMKRATGLRLLKQMREVATSPGPTIETEARMMHFITLLRRGMSPADAARQVKKYLFDYGDLSDFERKVMRRIIPFYTWQSKNLRLQIHELKRRPGLIAALQRPFNRDRGPDSDLLPEYLRGDLRVRLEPGPGKAAAFLTGIDIPIQNIDMIFAGSLEKTLRLNAGMLNPILKAPLELMFNEEIFSGRDIHGAQEMGKLGPVIKKMPKSIQEFFEFQEYQDSKGTPRYMANGTKVYLVLKSWALARFMSTAGDFEKMIASDEAVLDWWKIMTGLKVNEFDLDGSQRKLIRARYERLEKELIRRGLYRQFTVPYMRRDVKLKMGATQ